MSNLTKHQKRVLQKIPHGWNTEEDIKSVGIMRAEIAALQSKGFLRFKMTDGNKLFARVDS